MTDEELRDWMRRIEKKIDDHRRNTTGLDRPCYHASKKRDCPYYKGEIGRCNCNNTDWG